MVSIASYQFEQGYRFATKEDIPQIVALVNRSYRAVEAFFADDERTNASDIWNLMKPNTFFIVTERDDAIIGSVFVEVNLQSRQGYLGMLAVDLDQQGKGISAQLIYKAEALAKALGCTKMRLAVVSVRPALMNFYGKFGYKKFGSVPYERRGCKINNIELFMLERDL